jgi:D-proline reductase (dithiol) PrdB
MALEYLPIMAEAGASKPPRLLASPSRFGWFPVTRPLGGSRVALLTSAALRLENQPPFAPGEDLTYRLVPSDPAAGALIIDHHSRIGTVPREDPEIVFPRTALARLAKKGLVGSLSPVHLSFMGGVRRHDQVEDKLAPALARELMQARVDLALLVPY